jgi:Zn-dependent peptidase ImmA (M78 family)
MARQLDVAPEFFFVEDDEFDTPAYFRSLRSAPASELKRARHMEQLVHQITDELEDEVRLPELDLPRHRVSHTSVVDGPEQAARAVRSQWGLPAGPIDNMVRLLERHGIVVARLATGHEKVDAFSVPFGDRPIVMMSAAKGKKDRSRFDLAHELGHLAMHQPTQRATKLAEDEANRFAAEFLMPAHDIHPLLPSRPDWDRLGALKRTWGVSIASLLYRARELRKMDETTYVQAMKVLSARGWRRHEPVDLGPPESPVLLSKAMSVAGIDEPALATRTAMPGRLLREILELTSDGRPRVIV